MGGFGISGPAVRVLDVDGDLGGLVPNGELDAARARSVARVLKVDRRCWDPAGLCLAVDASWLGLLVVEGLLLRCVCVGSWAACELLSAGDVFRPWDADGEGGPLAVTVNWQVLRSGRVAVLDGEFARRMAYWPSVYGGLMQRVLARSGRLAVEQAVTRSTSMDDRLLLSFWLLADRCGLVTREGVVMTLPITHELLSTLVGCRRPTVTVALSKLDKRGLLRRVARDRWLLTHEALMLIHESDRLAEATAEAAHYRDRQPTALLSSTPRAAC